MLSITVGPENDAALAASVQADGTLTLSCQDGATRDQADVGNRPTATAKKQSSGDKE